MRTIDLTPLYRTSVGFDGLANMLDQVMSHDVAAPSYPPYNIEKTGENAYRITLAVAGFSEDDIDIEVKESRLTVKGAKAKPAGGKDPEWLHHGIAERGFERRFQLAEHVQVGGATLELGLLHIDLTREVPEEMKPRSIAINGKASPKTIAA